MRLTERVTHMASLAPMHVRPVCVVYNFEAKPGRVRQPLH